MARKVLDNPPPELEGVIIEATRSRSNGEAIVTDSGEKGILLKLRKGQKSLGWHCIGISDYNSYKPRLLS